MLGCQKGAQQRQSVELAGSGGAEVRFLLLDLPVSLLRLTSMLLSLALLQ